MSQRLTLRLLPADTAAFEAASAIIAGPAGAAFIGKTDVIRRALSVFLAVHQAQQQGLSK